MTDHWNKQVRGPTAWQSLTDGERASVIAWIEQMRDEAVPPYVPRIEAALQALREAAL